MKPCLLFLTCANNNEAELIEQALLKKKLAVCIKKTNVNSSFLWKGKIDNAEEVILIIDSVEELFNKIETTIRKIHSYETFVLFSIPIIKMAEGIESWMKSEMKVK